MMGGAFPDGRAGLSFETAAGLSSSVILGPETRGTLDHILLSQIRDFLNLKDHDPIFISPGNREAQLAVYIASVYGPHRKHRFQQFLHRCEYVAKKHQR
jgi:hypothetical protein